MNSYAKNYDFSSKEGFDSAQWFVIHMNQSVRKQYLHVSIIFVNQLSKVSVCAKLANTVWYSLPVIATSECSGETERMHRLIHTFGACLCYQNKHLMSRSSRYAARKGIRAACAIWRLSCERIFMRKVECAHVNSAAIRIKPKRI